MNSYEDLFVKIKKEPLDPKYPSRFLDLFDPPKEIYMAGEILPEDSLSLAVVGSRKMSSYGKDVCEYLVSEIAQVGVTIVSGLMYGVDLTAQRVALDVGGRTIGILGFGIDFLHKVQDATVVSRIIKEKKGAIISEFEPNESGAPWTFPKRNRLIAALSCAVLVIEAAEKSGSMYTVNSASELGRDVFAVPGGIFSPVSKGTNMMIKDGAKIATGVDDILEALEIESRLKKIQGKKELSASKDENVILDILSKEELHIDNIVRKSSFSVGKVSALLTEMELKGMVKSIGGGVYRRV